MDQSAHQYDPEEEDAFYREQEDKAARKARFRLRQGIEEGDPEPDEDYYNDYYDDTLFDKEKYDAEKKGDAASDLLGIEAAAAAGGGSESKDKSKDDDDDGGLFSDKDEKKVGIRGRAKGLIGNKLGLALGGIGVSAIMAVIGVGGFLSTFRLDHMLKNIDYKTFSRYNATMDGLSKNYIKAYMKIRLMEFENAGKDHLGDKDGNLFFRADKVYNGKNPTLDWYKSLRTGNFEKKVFNDQGIFFTSSVGPDGKIRPAKIILKDEVIDIDSDPNLSSKIREITPALESGNPTRMSAALNKFGPAMDSFVDKEFFDSDKSARKEIKKVVHENTKFYQVLKRRQLRKSIQNMIGVRSWTFFEKTRSAYRQKKQDITHKILNKVFSGNSETAKLLNCIFTGSCSTADDPNNPKLTEESGKISGIDEENSAGTDEKGNPKNTVENLGNDEAAKAADEAIDAVGKEETEVLTKGGEGSLSQKVIQALVKKFISEEAANAVPDPSKIWKYLKILNKFHHMVADGKVSKMVKRAKLVQLMAVYASLAIARDQSHTGELSMDEYGELIKTTDGFNNSEGWQAVENSRSSQLGSLFMPSAYAEDVKNVPKEEYCSGDHQKKKGEFAWFCDDQKPNNGGLAETLENTYNKTIGVLIAPISAAVDALQSIPIVSDVANFVSDITGKIIGAVTGPIIDAVLNGTGLGKDISGLLTLITQKLLNFLGAGPIWTGSEPGLGNFALAGSAGSAETATRAAGGVASTKLTLAYTNKLAANYQKENRESQSVFERYASLDNPTSLASSSLFAMTNAQTSKVPAGLLDSLASIPRTLATMFMHPVFADNETDDGSAMADLSGVDKYDVPQQCFDLDPLDPDYLNKATNAWDLGITPSWDTLKNTQDFWKQVYDKVGEDNEDAAAKIYNCETANAATRTGLGATNGYVDDGLDLNSSSGPGSTPGGGGGSTTTPTGNGKWSIAAGANRPGSSLAAPLTSFLNEVAKYTSYEPIVTTGTNHKKFTTSGHVSDHYSGNGADFGSVINKFGTSTAQSGQVVPRGDELAAAGMIACGVDPATARANALKGGVYNLHCTVNGQNLRVQVLWKTDTGGNHHNHVHIGVKPI